ncbi:MAG: DUF4279 domain-containing protein, partial [Planctomycetota bacterium]
MAECRETYAYFFVRSFECDSHEITRLLGFAPDEAHNRGEEYPSGRKRKNATWKRFSKLPRSTPDVSDHLEALLPILETYRENILQVAAGYCVGLQCVGYYTGVHPGFHMSSELLRRVSGLELSIDFDLYCYCAGEGSD